MIMKDFINNIKVQRTLKKEDNSYWKLRLYLFNKARRSENYNNLYIKLNFQI